MSTPSANSVAAIELAAQMAVKYGCEIRVAADGGITVRPHAERVAMTSAERVRRHRESKKIAECNDVTPVTVAATPVLESPKPNKRRGTLGEVLAFCQEEKISSDDGSWFFDKCEGCGWTNNKKPISDWRATLKAWKRAGYLPSQKSTGQLNLGFNTGKSPAYTTESALKGLTPEQIGGESNEL